ncbi:MAG: hypothetical protein ACP5N7_04595 [Candidatus Pacearchaeota archaeon]
MKPLYKVNYMVGEKEEALHLTEYTTMHPFSFIKDMEKRYANGAPLKIKSFTDLKYVVQGIDEKGVLF